MYIVCGGSTGVVGLLDVKSRKTDVFSTAILQRIFYQLFTTNKGKNSSYQVVHMLITILSFSNVND